MIESFKSYVFVDGSREFINSDTINCLKIIELLPNDLNLAVALFYKDAKGTVDEVTAMSEFIFKSMNDFKSEKGKQVIDYVKDFDAIWSSIYRVYHVDITEHLHWWKFLLMLSDLSEEVSIVHRITIRGTNLNDIQDVKMKSQISKEQNRLRLDTKLSLSERNKKWTGG